MFTYRPASILKLVQTGMQDNSVTNWLVNFEQSLFYVPLEIAPSICISFLQLKSYDFLSFLSKTARAFFRKLFRFSSPDNCNQQSIAYNLKTQQWRRLSNEISFLHLEKISTISQQRNF